MKTYSFDAFKQPDGTYLDEEGITHSSAEDFMCSRLGFCGCGCPRDALLHVQDSLQLVVDLTTLNKKFPGIHNAEWDHAYHEWRKQIKAKFPTTGAEYFMWYWLDNSELTEHGGAVPGWLTPLGELILKDLDTHFSK